MVAFPMILKVPFTGSNSSTASLTSFFSFTLASFPLELFGLKCKGRYSLLLLKSEMNKTLWAHPAYGPNLSMNAFSTASISLGVNVFPVPPAVSGKASHSKSLYAWQVRFTELDQPITYCCTRKLNSSRAAEGGLESSDSDEGANMPYLLNLGCSILLQAATRGCPQEWLHAYPKQRGKCKLPPAIWCINYNTTIAHY